MLLHTKNINKTEELYEMKNEHDREIEREKP